MKRKYRNTSFLIELLVNVLVFSIACAILAGLFVHAHLISAQTHNRSLAGNEMVSLSQRARADGVEALGAAVGESGELTFYYDANWQPAEQSVPGGFSIALNLEAQRQAGGWLYMLQFAAADEQGRELGTLHTALYAAEANLQGGAA